MEGIIIMKICISKIRNGFKLLLILFVFAYVLLFGLLFPDSNPARPDFGLWSATMISLGFGSSFCLLKNNYKNC